MIKQMKKTIGILLAVCFLMSVTAAAVSAVPSVVKEKKTTAGIGAGPIVVKDKKTAVLIFQHVKTKIFGHHHHKLHHHHKWHHHHKLTKAVKAMKTFVNS
jgi:uncharacterized protein (UPF0254 family)